MFGLQNSSHAFKYQNFVFKNKSNCKLRCIYIYYTTVCHNSNLLANLGEIFPSITRYSLPVLAEILVMSEPIVTQKF